jgi:hypothetical protein
VNPNRLPSPPHNPGVRDLVRGKREGSRPLAHEDIERGYLPRCDEPGLVQFVTFRLTECVRPGRSNAPTTDDSRNFLAAGSLNVAAPEDGRTPAATPARISGGKFLKDYRTDW